MNYIELECEVLPTFRLKSMKYLKETDRKEKRIITVIKDQNGTYIN